MTGSEERWSLSTVSGANLSADELGTILSSQHERTIAAWRSLSSDQWAAASRNTSWTVHDTARHVADAMDVTASQLRHEPSALAEGRFDPNSTPDLWLQHSSADSTDRTIERYEAAAVRHRECVGDRLAAADAGTAFTPYGSAHWTMLTIHIFWDAWLHERDIALPLGVEAESTLGEQRLVALYAMLMGVVPALTTKMPFQASVGFTGPANVTVTASHESGTLTSAETDRAEMGLSGELCSIVDSLSGRGAPLQESLPGAPDMLEALGKFLRA